MKISGTIFSAFSTRQLSEAEFIRICHGGKTAFANKRLRRFAPGRSAIPTRRHAPDPAGPGRTRERLAKKTNAARNFAVKFFLAIFVV